MNGARGGAAGRLQSSRPKSGFSLVEMLTVLLLMSVLAALAVPAFTTVKDADNVTNASYIVSSELQRARNYAIAHNTYVWVGFYEENADAPAPTNVQPPYTGIGRVIIGLAASIDGTQIYTPTTSATSATQIPPSRLVQIDNVIRVQNVHITDLGAPTGGTTLISNRPNGAYSNNGTPSATELYGINSENNAEAPYYFTIGSYSFYKTICFNPSGEASINCSPALRRIGEIDLRPTHGDTLNQNTPNVAAIQFTGIGGAVQTYRN